MKLILQKEKLSYSLCVLRNLNFNYQASKFRGIDRFGFVEVPERLICNYSNRIYLQNWLRNLSLIVRNLFLAEFIFKIGSINLLSTEPTFLYRGILKFRGMVPCCCDIITASIVVWWVIINTLGETCFNFTLFK